MLHMPKTRVPSAWRICRRAMLGTCCIATTAAHAELNHQYVEVSASFLAYERDVGDIDSDGDNDFVCVREGDTSVEVFRAPDWAQSTLITITGVNRWPRADDFKVADMDGDGDVDVVVRLGPGPASDAAGLAAWYENLGAGTGWTQRVIGNSLEYVKDIVVADIDRDTRPDVAMRMDSQTQLWLQETNGTWTEVLLTHPSHEGMEAGDLDMDGDPDLVLNGFWFPSPDTPAACRVAGNYVQQAIDAQWYTQSGDWTANSCKAVVGDFDGDGTNDVAFSHSERAGYHVTWYRRSGASWTPHSVAEIDYAHNLQAYDADFDGDVDLLAGGMVQSAQKGLQLYLNDGTGTNWTLHPIQTNGSYSAEVGDIDNDGDLDIIGIVNWDAPPTYIYRSNAGGPPSLHFWRYIRASDSHVRTFGLAFGDADGDGDRDIASGPYLYRNPGGSMTASWPRITAAAGRHLFLMTDIDGDARADALALEDNPGENRIDLYWHEAQSDAATNWAQVVRIGHVSRSSHEEGFQGYRLFQIEAGGRPEVAVSSSNGLCYFVIPADPSTGTWPRVFVASNDSDEGIGIEDIDGDHAPDIAFTGGMTKSIQWAKNPGDGTANWNLFAIGSFPEADWIDRCEVVDVNGDGRADIVATEEDSGGSPDALCYWWEQPESSPTQANWARHLVTTRYTMNSLDAADVDLDGDPDLVLAEHRGTRRISVFANDGAGTFVEFPVGTGEENHLGARLVDLDEDGDLDLAGIAYDDFTRLHVWRNDSPTGVPTVAEPLIAPNGGIFDEPVSVALACSTPGAEIRFTTDGSDPTETSTLYTATFLITVTTTVKARGYKADLAPSPIATTAFIGPQVRPVAILPSGGIFVSSQMVALACATTGATIRCTVDGSSVSEASPAYAGPFLLTSTVLVRARAYRNGLAPSPESEATFTRFALGAVAQWRLDERFGNVAYDSSGSHRNGTIFGATRVTGHKDRALLFDGADDYVAAGSWHVPGTAMTICAWIRIGEPYDDKDPRVLSKAVGSAEQDHDWMLSLTMSGGDIRPRFRLKTDDTTATLIAGSGNLAPGTWYHLAAVYDGGAMRLFVDGSSVGSLAKSGNLSTGSALIYIGANPPAAYAPFKGELDDVCVYNVALDATQLLAVAQESPPQDPPELRALHYSPPSTLVIRSSSLPGHYGVLEFTTSLLNGVWTATTSNAWLSTESEYTNLPMDASGVFRIRQD